ncbi:MAG: hypothetical protein HYS70_04485 [Nitrospinae bacterium]|nr:hypothetical protein [Nitrospinota bacterium]
MKTKQWWKMAVTLVAILFFLLQPSARADETDSAVLIDNFALKVNGTPINPNFDFETGTLDGFTPGGDVRVVNNVGSIGSPDGSAHFALLTTGVGAIPGSSLYVFDISLLRQPFSINPGDEVAVSLCFNFLTNENDRLHPAFDQFALFGANARLLRWGAFKFASFKEAPPDSGWLYEMGWQCHQDIPLTLLMKDQGFSSSSAQVQILEVVKMPTIQLSLNQTSFRPGETLVLSATVNHDGPLSLDFDAKAYVRVPPPGPGVKDSYLNILNMANVHVSPGTSFSGEILRYTFTGSEPLGSYFIEGTHYSSIGYFFNFDFDSKSFRLSPPGSAPAEGPPPGLELPFALEIGP